jgi:hypothetical protein
LRIKQGVESRPTILFSFKTEKDAEKGHSERSEESIFMPFKKAEDRKMDSSLRFAPFRMTEIG